MITIHPISNYFSEYPGTIVQLPTFAVRVLSSLVLLFSALLRFLRGTAPTPVPTSPNVELIDGRICVLIVDVSPSMTETDWKPSRLAAAKEAAKEYANEVAKSPGAHIAVVSYAYRAYVSCPLMPAADIQKVHESIDAMKTGHATNIAAGLRAGLEQRPQFARPEFEVVLLSDGWNNTGKDPVKVATSIKQYGIIECIGIAGTPTTVDEELMKDIASPRPDGTKRYRWIGDQTELKDHLRKLGGGLMRA